jgi:putative copper export protein/methionine-rich copper-binding protein CopC
MSRRIAAHVRAVVVALWIASGLLLTAGDLLAHPVLRSAVPAADARVLVPPRELRLTFNEGVEISFSHLRLLGPGGTAVPLGALAHPADSGSVLVASVNGPLAPGDYRVEWTAAGSDGHPTNGGYAFTVAPPPQPIAAAVDTSVGDTIANAHHDPELFPERAGFGVGSPAYVVVRWLSFIGLLGVIGAVAFLELVLPRAPLGDAGSRAARIGVGCAALLAVAALLRLGAQAYALGAADGASLASLLFRTTWGWGWLLQLAAALTASAGLTRYRGAGRPLCLAAAAALALSAALSGHAAAAPRLGGIAVASDALHVLGAGAWLGTLLLVVLAGLPTAARLPTAERGPALAALVDAFSRVAIVAAGVVLATGAFAAWLHLGSLALLWRSVYGRTLLLKIALLAVVFAIGAYNQSLVRPALVAHGEVGARRLQRSATLELAFGALVLLVTAVLVATSPPGP